MSPSWALRGPISFSGGATPDPIAQNEGLEVLIVQHPNQYARKIIEANNDPGKYP